MLRERPEEQAEFAGETPTLIARSSGLFCVWRIAGPHNQAFRPRNDWPQAYITGFYNPVFMEISMERDTMQDIFYLLIVLVFFALSAAYTRGCDKL